MPNRLAGATSPYLQQHAHNPVDWYPWGEEAFAAARRRDVPVFLSVGYSTCHWCHVMARESFEDPGIAALLNASYVPVKVDREERPDVDAVHMAAAQAMGVRGGWPLSVFLTPDGLPFFAGTYWPAAPHPGLPTFPDVLTAVADAWLTQRDSIAGDARHLVAALRAAAAVPTPVRMPPGALDDAVARLARHADRRWGGFGSAPKFPVPPVLVFLLRHHARTGDPDALAMVEVTLSAMADGGIHDQLGGGFARYATDARWRLPHFEKMLYDNAQLLELYADLALATGSARHRAVALGIGRWMEREMRHGDAFAAALDADSEGEEGRFSLWTPAQVRDALAGEPDDDVQLLLTHLGITGPGAVPRIASPVADLAAARATAPEDVARRVAELVGRLARAREQRVHPARDDKVVASWNGLAVHGLAHAGAALGEPWMIELARAAAGFVLTHLASAEGGLARSWNAGRTSGPAVLEDYGAVARGLLTLHSATGEDRWLQAAEHLVVRARVFAHDSGTGFHDSLGADLFLRPRDLGDGVQPSGNALMAEVLAILATHRWDESLREEAGRIVAATRAWENPLGGGFALAVAERLATAPRELVLTGEPSPQLAGLRDVALRRFDPLLVVGYAGTDHPVIGRVAPVTAAHLCEGFACRAPVTEPAALAALLA